MQADKQQRNTPSRALDASVGRRAHMLMWDGKRKQGDVAREMGITSDGLGRKLRGERGWALQEVADIAAVLGTSVSYLIGEGTDDLVEGQAQRTTD